MNRQYIRTERAHYTCPNMHFGIRFSIAQQVDKNQIAKALMHLAAARPFLRALIDTEVESGQLYYRVTDENQVQLLETADEFALLSQWDGIALSKWNVRQQGLLRVFFCPVKDGTMLLFAAHHLLTDGRGLWMLCEDFIKCLQTDHPLHPVQEALIASQVDLPKGSDLRGISKLLVGHANRQWRCEAKTIDYAQYLAFEHAYCRTHSIVYQREQMDGLSLRQSCRAHGVSVNDYLSAQMCASYGARKLVMAADLRPVLPGYRIGAMGNYATAFSVSCPVRGEDLWAAARQVRKQVQRIRKNPRRMLLVLSCYLQMEPALLDAAAMAALGGFDSRAAQLVGGGLFGLSRPTGYSITNLGSYENELIRFAEFIPPSSPSAKAVAGVLSVNGVLRKVTALRLEVGAEKREDAVSDDTIDEKVRP